MRAMILAAGRGERLRPLTDAVPKPLLPVAGKPLVHWMLERLAASGIRDVVVNTAHLGERLQSSLGDGSPWGVRIAWSREQPALETAGGIAQALPLLGDAPFVVVSGDIHTDFDFAALAGVATRIAADPMRHAAHFVLVDNPPWHPQGDMALVEGRVQRAGPMLTYGNIGVFHPSLFDEVVPGTTLALFPWAYRFVEQGRVTGEHFQGQWDNVGTAAQLSALERRLSAARPGAASR